MIYERQATSQEMEKNIRVVKKMTGSMGFDENMGKVNWKFVRAMSNFGYKFMPKEKECKYKKIKLNSHKALMVYPKEKKNDNIIIYIHGGGFVSGSAFSSKGYTSMLANYSGCIVVALEYGLAPERPYPCGVNHCYESYQELLKLYTNSKFAVVGESAGANLSIVLGLKDRLNNINRISAIIVHSPIIDFSGSIHRTNKINDFTVKEGCLKPLNDLYVGNNDNKNYDISPIYGNYSNYPATFITCDSNETLYEDSKILYDMLEKK